MSAIQLDESGEQHIQAERRINSLKSILDEKEKELNTAAQKLQEAVSASATHDTVIKQLEEAMQRQVHINICCTQTLLYWRPHLQKKMSNE